MWGEGGDVRVAGFAAQFGRFACGGACWVGSDGAAARARALGEDFQTLTAHSTMLGCSLAVRF